MPKNNDVKKVTPASGIRFDITPKTEYINNIDAINIKLLGAMPIEELKKYIGNWCKATWAKDPLEHTGEEIDDYIKGAIEGSIIPGVLETIHFTFLIDGIDLIAVTHLLRHRGFAFSADCSADKMWHEKKCLVPNAIQNSDEIFERYKSIVEQSKQLYCDIINSKQISIMDARHILPRCLSTYYLVHCNLRDLIGFLKQRIDKQIQPETDNIIAYRMYLEVVKTYPFLKGLIDLHAPAFAYIKQANTDYASNVYLPDKDSDIFEYNENSFVYQCTRDKLNGTNKNAENHFNKVFEDIEQELNTL